MLTSTVVEPLVVVALLFGGVYINRNTDYELSWGRPSNDSRYQCESDDSINLPTPAVLDDCLLEKGDLLLRAESRWRKREVRILRFRLQVTSPNTAIFQDYFLSRLLRKFPFLVECWYWALIYWVYQLGRAITAVTLDEKTVEIARVHALQVIALEQRLHIFLEPEIQQVFLKHDTLMHWINRIYSYIHIPGTIFFLVSLYYYAIARNRRDDMQRSKDFGVTTILSPNSSLYQARRRTMAMCNLLAFLIFAAWPCMPPRLLSDARASGESALVGQTFGFVDTVHRQGGESSMWTQNKFCNQYAAMPSLHFGYSLLIGVTMSMIPLSYRVYRSPVSAADLGHFRLISPHQSVHALLGGLYPLIILVAIIATANHFILDAVAGACVCVVAWWGNRFLLNLLPIEDYFLWYLRICKPQE